MQKRGSGLDRAQGRHRGRQSIPDGWVTARVHGAGTQPLRPMRFPSIGPESLPGQGTTPGVGMALPPRMPRPCAPRCGEGSSPSAPGPAWGFLGPAQDPPGSAPCREGGSVSWERSRPRGPSLPELEMRGAECRRAVAGVSAWASLSVGPPCLPAPGFRVDRKMSHSSHALRVGEKDPWTKVPGCRTSR